MSKSPTKNQAYFRGYNAWTNGEEYSPPDKYKEEYDKGWEKAHIEHPRQLPKNPKDT